MSIKFEIPTANLGDATTVNHTVTGTFTVDGYIINPSSATPGQILRYNGSSFIASNETSVGIGSSFGGTTKSVLYIDGSNLAQDNSNFAWDFTNHRLGIGTNAPSYPLHVVGDSYLTSRLIINASSASVSSSGTGALRYNTSTNHLEFSENGGAYTAFGSGGSSIGSAVTSGTAKSVLYVDGSGNLAQDNSNFAWDGTNHRLGLGNNSPLYALDVYNASDVSALHIRTGASSDDGLYFNAGASGGATISVGAKNTGSGTWQARSITAGLIDVQSSGLGYYFNTGLTIGGNFTPTRKFLIDSSGNVLIGDTSATTGKLQIETQDSVYGQVQIANTSNNSESSISFISGATALGTSPTSTNGTDHVWAVGAGVFSIGGAKFGVSNTAAAGPIITVDGTNYRLGVGQNNSSPATTLDIGNPSTTASLALRSGSTAAVSSASTGRIRYNESTQHFEISENGGSYAQMASGGGAVSSVSNSDGTLTISPTTGAVVASLALGHANTWSAKQSFSANTEFDGYIVVKDIGTGVKLSNDTSSRLMVTDLSGGNATIRANVGYFDAGVEATYVENPGAGAITIYASSLLPSPDNSLNFGSSAAKWHDGYFGGQLVLDGYNIDLSAGAITNQVLQYNGTKFLAATVSSGGIGASSNQLISIIPGGSRSTGISATPLVVHSLAFDPNIYTVSGTTKSIVFRAVVATGNTTVTGHVKLRDITTGQDITTFNITNQATQTKSEQVLTTGTPGTNVIANSEKYYEVRIYVDSPTLVDDTIELYSAEIRVINTVT